MSVIGTVLVGSAAFAQATDPRQRMIEAAGVHAFDRVEQVTFTFNVERDGELGASRQWRWWPRTNVVSRQVDGETYTYDRDEMSDADREVDRQFINDSFWLSPPLHVSWAGPDVRVADEGEASMPIGDGEARKLVVAYPADGGGYTPGDVYELFLDDEGLIRAWVFRRGGAEEPTLVTTFSDYVLVSPLRIATEHRNADGSFRLYFTDVQVQADVK